MMYNAGMKTSITNTRKDGVTKDVQADAEVVQTFNFPTLGVSVEARNMSEALIKAKAEVKSK
jgi:hypothetical protein